MAQKVTRDMILRFADEVEQHPATEWAERITARASLWGVTPSTLRRRLRSQGGLDLGGSARNRESYLPDSDAETISAMIARTIRKGRPGLDLETAVDIAWKEGLLASEKKPSVSVVSRRMNDLGIGVRQLLRPAPHTPLKSEFANHVHQLDASLCIQWHFGPRGMKVRHVDLRKLDQTRKNVKQAIHRWALVDHLSGAFVVDYYDSPGERKEDLLRFLHYAWSEKKDPRVPFCGVPEILYIDRGPAHVSHSIRNLCRAYGIELKYHGAGIARATGAVEATHWVHERKFEARLGLSKISNIDELIEKARLEALRVNTTRPHSRHGRTRYDAWSQAVRQPVRVPVEDFQQFVWLAHDRHETRRVTGDLTISVSGQEWRIPDARVGQEVWIRPHPFEAGVWRCFDDAHGEELKAEQVTKDEWGFKSHAVPFGEFQRRQPTEAEVILERAKTLQITQAFTTDDELPEDLYRWDPVPTTPAREVPAAGPVLMSRVEAKQLVIERIGRRLTREEGRWWNEQLDDEVGQEALERLLAAFNGEGEATPVLVALTA